MQITLRNSHGFTEVIFEAENVKVVEDISETIYALKEDGKKDINKRLGKDITEDAMSQFVRFMDDLVYYREKEFDSSDLVERLVEKLPEEKRQELLKKLFSYHEIV